MKQYVFEVLEEMAKQRSRDDKVKVLKENETWALKDVIRGAMDSTVTWNLPIGSPPYTASAAHGLAVNDTVRISCTTNFNDSDLASQSVIAVDGLTFNMTLSAGSGGNDSV